MKTIIMTGAGKRMGKGLALEFAKKGWDIILHYNKSEESALDAARQIHSFGQKAYLFQSDLRKEKNVKDMFNEIINNCPIPSALINNAGQLPPKIELNDLNENFIDNIFDINTKAALWCSREFSEIAAKDSSIVNIASIGGLEVWKDRLGYNVSKAALIHLTKVLAVTLAPKIKVNCICPGTIEIPGEPAAEDLIDVSKIPTKRYGTIIDVFQAVEFFTNCSNFITGQIISVDGGYHLKK